MKTLKFVVLMSVMMITGCAVTADAPTSDPTEETSSTSTSTTSDELTLHPEASSCHGVEQACATAFNCHHGEGRNIGTLGCPTGQICCQF